jgi:F-type H+-transporting ATPase subunit gamma
MAGSKEIRTKIKSVENTRKITKAMEMVAASKMRKAQDRMRAARPYAEKIRNVAAHMSFAEPEYKHPFLIKRDAVKTVGIIVVTSDKGLCGGLNTNALRVAVNQMQAWEAAKSFCTSLCNRKQRPRFYGPYQCRCEITTHWFGRCTAYGKTYRPS